MLSGKVLPAACGRPETGSRGSQSSQPTSMCCHCAVCRPPR